MSLYSLAEVADLLSVSKETLRRWDRSGKLVAERHPINGYRAYSAESLDLFDPLWRSNPGSNTITQDDNNKRFTSVELFAGAGGLALGFEEAGFECMLLNEVDRDACNTLRANRPNWNVVEGDVRSIDFTSLKGKVDVLTGGFPCQAFSYAGKKLGLEDVRGTLFYEFARAANECKPLMVVGENVRGLLSHDNGRTLAAMITVLDEIGYSVVPPRVLRATDYDVPQKRERLFLIAVRKDVTTEFRWPSQSSRQYNLRDALKKGSLYDTDVPKSAGQKYPDSKKRILKLIPPGGYWRDLPIDLQKEYMMKSYYLGGGKTGIARRISWDEPCLTLTCSPAQKQTERCHPTETRPFTVREYARIQTFPDNWSFAGSTSSQYKQIGNAVPVNLAKHVATEILNALKLAKTESVAQK